MATQNIILVAGFNYENARNPTFLQSANNRMSRLLAKSKSSADLVFTLFDVGGGVIKQSKVDPKVGKRSWNEIKRFNSVTTANYSSFVTGKENVFDKNPSGVMSITDIYSFVQDIGAGSDKGTVTELSFFTHGFMGGPILVNSFEGTSFIGSASRDSDDKDARQVKDFIAPTMEPAALAKFTAAFADTSIVWIWGCVFNAAANRVLGRLFKSSKFRSTAPGKIKDTDKFTFDFSEDDPAPSPDDAFNNIVNLMLPGGKLSGRDYTVNVTFQKIKDSFERTMSRTYADKISKAILSGGIVFAALPGTGTDYEELDKNVRLPLMVVPTRMPPFSNNFSQSLLFYKTYLNIGFDPENRGYGAF
jgi:hypothetical protein